MSPGVPTLISLLLVAGLAGCSSSQPEETSAPPAPTRLVAKLVSPKDVTLSWKSTQADVAGRTVEFATEPNGQYTILQFVSPSQTTYEHRDLMPETTFYYRVRPYFGPASRPVDVTLPPGEYDENSADDEEWAKPHTDDKGPVPAQTIRNPTGAAAAAPTDFVATVMNPNGIKFTWTDRASDEEGYLLEAKPDGSADYTPVEVLDPNITLVGLITLPNEKKASYRVRAFYYGESSNIAHEKTGKD
jgi:Fibronectin type III domain